MDPVGFSAAKLAPYQRTQYRKLRRPRTSQACDFCRKRKKRCSGQNPCTACIEEAIVCKYSHERPPRRRQGSSLATMIDDVNLSQGFSAEEELPSSSPLLEARNNDAEHSRSNSVDPPDTAFDHGLHVGPSSGVAFLYKWQEGGDSSQPETMEKSYLASYGDTPLPKPPNFAAPLLEEGRKLVDHYFRFAVPTFRFFHRQSLDRWMEELLLGKPTHTVNKASVFIVWAQALMYSATPTDGHMQIPEKSLSYFEQARLLLASEPGPAQVTSVEARLAICLYLLSVYHIVECRFLLGFTYTLVVSLGLHRKTPKRYSISPLEAERRKRAFWSFYVLDGYMGVMLGHPRHLRDEDIDQDLPSNVEDLVLDSAVDLSQVPHHGNLEAFIYHLKLARSLARGNDLLYSIQRLTKEEIITKGEEMIEILENWQKDLPSFLTPRASASLGTQTWERQNSVLGLAVAHTRILATRRCLLVKTPLRNGNDDNIIYRHKRCIQVCIESVYSILDSAHQMMHHGRLLWGFWLTRYITMCAISTLLIYEIQRKRNILPDGNQRNDKLVEHYKKAEELQEYLARVAPPGSQTDRHHKLLNHLRRRAKKSVISQAPQDSQNRSGGLGLDMSVANQHSGFVGLPHTFQDPPQSTDVAMDETFTPRELLDITFPDPAFWEYADFSGMPELDDTLWAI